MFTKGLGKRIAALAMTAILLLTNIPVQAFAVEAGDANATEQDGGYSATLPTTDPGATTPGTNSEDGQDPYGIAPASELDGEPVGLADDVITFPMTASISGANSVTILAGEKFDYVIGYTVQPLPGTDNYVSPSITLDLTNYADRLSVSQDANNKLLVTGPDVVSTIWRNGKLTINLTPNLTIGEARVITVTMQTDNMEWANGAASSVIKLDPKLVASTTGGDSVVGSIASDKLPTVTVTANDGWKVEKTRGTVTTTTSDGQEYYVVPYTVNIINTDKNGNAASVDRLGRLNVESITLNDVLPTAETSSSNHIHNGYPAGGQAAKVTNVKMNGTALTEGTDYSVNGSGSITINKMNKQATATTYIPAGAVVNSSYTYEVWFPKSAYLTPSNQSIAETYELNNTANLKYRLLGETEKTSTSAAKVTLGEKAEAKDKVNLTVKKTIEIGGTDYAYKTTYGTVAFTLYEDAACTVIANNYNGTTAAGAEKEIPASGTVTFADLMPGTYYLKETRRGDGLVSQSEVTKVTINAMGIVTVENNADASASASTATISNTATKHGNLEFYKYGKDSVGTKAALSGATFTLTSKSDSSKKYTATSDANGRVFFEGIPAGEYTLKETAVSGSDFTADPTEISVTIVGNQLVRPTGLPNPDTIESVNGAPVFENVSPKGKFQIAKVDSKTGTKLSGAQFDVYEKNSNGTRGTKVQSNLTTGANGVAVSNALPAGQYILVETKAPEGYAISQTETLVTVTANQMNSAPIEIPNDELIAFHIRKRGTITQNGSAVTAEELAGAKFEIYAADKTTKLATVETYLDGSGASTSGVRGSNGKFTDLKLAPGTYYYKEIQAPAGYEIGSTALQEVVLNPNSRDVIVTVTNSAAYARIDLTKTKEGDSNTKLAGAKFGVYTDAACTQPYKENNQNVTMTTDSNGLASVRVAAPQDGSSKNYWLKEITAPSGYALSTTPIPVTVSKNAVVAVGATNTELRSIKINKEDSVTKAKVSGVKFELYGPYDTPLTDAQKNALSGSSTTKTTGSNGEAVFSGLQPGKYYYVKETSTNTNYVLPAQRVTEFQTTTSSTQLQTVKTITNDRKGSIVINKTHNMDNGGAYQGAQFSLYNAVLQNGTYVKSGNAVKTGTTPANGQLTFSGLTPGHYILEEAPIEGYAPMAPKHIEVKPGDNAGNGYGTNVQNIVNEANKGKLALDKVSSTSSSTHIAANFDIYKKGSDGKPTGEKLGVISTTNNANASYTGWMEPGEYVLVETSVTGNYTVNPDPIPFTIVAGKTTQLTGNNALTNTPQGKVTLSKNALFALQGGSGNTTYPLTGASFSFYKKTSNNAVSDIAAQSAPVTTLDMTNSSSATTGFIDTGDYWIVETVFPANYKADASATAVTIGGKTCYVVDSVTVTAGQTASKNIVNKTDLGKLRINKTNMDGTRLLDGAQFEVYKADPSGTVTAPDGTKVTRVSVTASTAPGSSIMESGTAGTGSALSVDIQPGKYYIKETDVSKVNRQYGGEWHPVDSEWRGPITVEAGKESVQQFENYVTNAPGQKTDVNGQPISGAVFAAFDTKEKAIFFLSYLEGRQISTNAANKTQLVSDLATASFRSTYSIVDVSTASAANGQFFFHALQPGKTYYIVEAVPPTGYSQDYNSATGVYTVTVSADGTGFTANLVVRDYKLGKLTITKQTVLNGETMTVEGVGFKVYAAVPNEAGTYVNAQGAHYNLGTLVAEGTTGSNGKYTTILLEQGVYIVVEDSLPNTVTWPDGYSAANKPYKIAVITSGGNTATSLDQALTFENPPAYGKFVFKKVDESNKVMANVTFKLYKSTDLNNAVATYTTSTANNGIIVSGFLPAGTYVLKETAVNGYTKANDITFTIESGKVTGSTDSRVPAGETNSRPDTNATTSQPIIIVNRKQGKLDVYKVGMFGTQVIDQNLEGVQFGLYKDAACTQLVRAVWTNANGLASWSNLDAGTYYLKELAKDNTKEAKYYDIDTTTVRTITINVGQTTSFANNKIPNNTNCGKFTVKKVDANDAATVLSGVDFNIYTKSGSTYTQAKDINGTNASMTTGADGIATSGLLPEGEYYVKETKTASGYVLSDTYYGPFTVVKNTTTDGTTNPIENVKQFTIGLTKYDSRTNTGLAGAQVGLYATEADAAADTNAIQTVTSASDGKVTFNKLSYGLSEITYYVHEVSAPAGYEKDNTVYPVVVSYAAGKSSSDLFTIRMGTNAEGQLLNDQLGTVTVMKIGSWQGINDTEAGVLPLSGVEFTLYKVDARGDAHAADAASYVITTNAQGVATSPKLPAGWYEVVETGVPDGYAQADNVWTLIENNSDDAVLVDASGAEIEDNTIVNVPAEGKFILYKHDGSSSDAASELLDLGGAVFELRRKGDSTSTNPADWALYNPDEPTISTRSEDGKLRYSSAALPADTYALIEKTAPTYTYTENGASFTIHFTMDETPVVFDIREGVTVPVHAYNSPKGSIILTKFGMDATGEDSKTLLHHASFALYSDAACQNKIAGSDKATNSRGVIEWTDLDYGTYYIKETTTNEALINAQGYSISTEVKSVTIDSGKTVAEVRAGDLEKTVEFVNEANQGKIRILKVNEDGDKLTGAQFKIMGKDAQGEWSVTVQDNLTITNAQQGVVSNFLPAASTGTEYKVIETKAPNNYTLDDELKPIELIVKVYPIHNPAEEPDGAKNCFQFVNKKINDIKGLDAELHKGQKNVEDTEYTDGEISAKYSLQTHPYTIDYQVTGYGDGTNEKPIRNLIVTDDLIKAYGLSKLNDGSMEDAPIALSAEDYLINSLTVGKAYNSDADEIVSAKVYIKSDTTEDYIEYQLIDDLSDAVTIDFKAAGVAVVGIKVEYMNTLKEFTAEGLSMNVTFAERVFSEETDYEVRKITNQANIAWDDVFLDNEGNEQVVHGNPSSNVVVARIPSVFDELPQIQIQTEITDAKSVFYSGDEMHFRVTATNVSTEAEKVLFEPVISFKLPAQTNLRVGEKGAFTVKKVTKDGTVIMPTDNYVVVEETVPAAIRDLGNDTYGTQEGQNTTQYSFVFTDSVQNDMDPGDQIVIEFSGDISYEDKSGMQLVIPGYFSSNHLIPPSKENDLGLSFTAYNSAALRDNEIADDAANNELLYVNDTDSRDVTAANAVKLLKEVGAMNDGGTIDFTSTRTVYVNSGDEIYYRLTVYNFSDEALERAKIVDIFPDSNDSYVTVPGTARDTSVPFGPGYEDMKLLDVSGAAGYNVTYYTTTQSWQSRSGSETGASGILQPLYFNESAWNSVGWSTGITEDASALGIEIDFGAEGLAPGDSCSFIIHMRMPGYTADKISEYVGKVVNNSAALSVVKVGNTEEEIPLYERVEPPKVSAGLRLPTGAIGDKVWVDENRDGIQDPDEEPVQGMKVELWQTRYYKVGDIQHREVTRIATTETNQDGNYLFTNLPCQYLIMGKDPDSTDPDDYVGGEFYEYQVRFIKTDSQTFTLLTQGDDIEVDSDADAEGYAAPVKLFVLNDPVTNKLVGEVNLSIDAGITSAFSLGNRVWLDTNCDGLQGDDEPGVEGVPVFLYKVVNGVVSDEYLARTETNANGEYLFEDLIEGEYVVEFDITNLKKLKDPDSGDSGYTYRYDFTKPNVITGHQSDTDSDARNEVPGTDGRMMRTDVIKLNDTELTNGNLYDRYDPRWDAGLVVYSAIGGFVFDDMDYDDLQSLKLPLTGTVVELYEVGADGQPAGSPIATQTVGDDGRYFFDHLTFATQTKDYAVKFTYPDGYFGVNANAAGDGATPLPGMDDGNDSDVNVFPVTDGVADRTQGFIAQITLSQDMITTTWDAGARKYSAIGDYVWIDGNKDGIQDEDEEAIPGIPVILQKRDDPDSAWTYVAMTVTDENGKYIFEELESSDYIDTEYRVVFGFAEDTIITELNSGSNTAVDSDAGGVYLPGIAPQLATEYDQDGGFVTTQIKPSYGETDLTWDAGIIVEYGSIGDYVWYDTDHDGIQSDEHKPVPNVPVTLEMNTSADGSDPEAWIELGQTTTDEQGKYLFEGLNAGYYRVKFELPKGYVNTRYNRGTGENASEVDSNASRPAGNNCYYTATFYLAQGQNDMTWDAGIYKPRTIRRTGDDMPLLLLSAMCVISLAGMAVVSFRKKKEF